MICRPNHRDLKLIVRVHDNGPTSWRTGKTLLAKVVDTHSLGLLHLVDFIAEHCMWGSKQYITVWRDQSTDLGMRLTWN